MSDSDPTILPADRPHADVNVEWTKPGAPGVTAESFEASSEVPAYFSLSFRDGTGRASRRLFTLYLDASHGETMAERLEAAADVLRSRRLDAVKAAVADLSPVSKSEPTCDCRDSIEHAKCPASNVTPSTSEEAGCE